MAWFAKLLFVGLTVFLSALTVGAAFTVGVMNGPRIAQDIAFGFGAVGAFLGAAAFLAIYLATRTASFIIGSLAGGGLTALMLLFLPGGTDAAGFAAFCGVGAAIGSLAALCGGLALRTAGLPVRRIGRARPG